VGMPYLRPPIGIARQLLGDKARRMPKFVFE
jgi:hypothetical protein